MWAILDIYWNCSCIVYRSVADYSKPQLLHNLIMRNLGNITFLLFIGQNIMLWPYSLEPTQLFTSATILIIYSKQCQQFWQLIWHIYYRFVHYRISNSPWKYVQLLLYKNVEDVDNNNIKTHLRINGSCFSNIIINHSGIHTK